MGTPCTWWEYTGRYTEFVDNISSPIMRNLVTGEECSGRDLPAGALWVAGGDPSNYAKGCARQGAPAARREHRLRAGKRKK